MRQRSAVSTCSPHTHTPRSVLDFKRKINVSGCQLQSSVSVSISDNSRQSQSVLVTAVASLSLYKWQQENSIYQSHFVWQVFLGTNTSIVAKNVYTTSFWDSQHDSQALRTAQWPAFSPTLSLAAKKNLFKGDIPRLEKSTSTLTGLLRYLTNNLGLGNPNDLQLWNTVQNIISSILLVVLQSETCIL